MEQRNLLLAIVLSVGILFGFQFLIEHFHLAKPPAQPTPAPGTTTSSATPGVGMPTEPGVVGPQAIPGTPQPAAVLTRETAIAEQPRIRINTPRLHGSIALRGGRIDDLTLATYHETPNPASPEVVLLEPSGTGQAYFSEFGWVAGVPGTVVPGPDTVWTASGGPLTPTAPVILTWDNGQGLVFTRTISVDENYMFMVRDAVRNNTGAPVTLSPYGLISRTSTPNVSGYYILHEGPVGYLAGSLREPNYSSLKPGEPQEYTSTGGWLGFTDKYWLTSLVPPQDVAVKARFNHQVEGGVDRYQTDFLAPPVSVPAEGTAATDVRFFGGAKEVNLLDAYAESGIPHFDLAIDFGWFYFLTKPIFLVLQWFYGLLGNFGLAILLLTLLIKLAFFPLANKSYQAMSKMKLLQPEMQKIRERFPDDKARQQQEMMEMYKRVGANPVAGCLPIIIQISVFFALYKVLFVTIEMRHAPFFGWIHDLSAPDPTTIFNLFGLIPFTPPHILMIGAWPLIMGVTMFLQQKLNPQPVDPVQARMFMLLPVVFTYMLAAFPAGLVIYWAWNNLLSIGQQWAIMHPGGCGLTKLIAGEPIADSDLFPPRALDTDEVEAGRLLFARECRFVAGAADEGALPSETLPEVAFVGRSNVGKSSLVNALTGRRTLARTSNTPGRTRQINFFVLAERLMLVDLPGYGYAEASKSAIKGWTRLMQNYLRGRSSLRRVCLLIDSRHGVKEPDRALMTLCDAAGLSYQAVLTKIDKLGPETRAAAAESVAVELARHTAAHPEFHLTSAEKRLGVAALRATLAGFADMASPRHRR